MKNKDIIILIGAARSGTKAFRDLLGTNTNISVVPYDINYIWSIGNENNKNDLFTPDLKKSKVSKKIKRFIDNYFKGNTVLVEKTVSNTIRVPYILSIYPNAKFVFLYREGLDVIESVGRQWDKEVEKKYILNKLKHVPFKQLLTYGLKFIKRNLNKTAEDYFWGVKTPNLIDDLNSLPRIEAIANQWDFCVSKMLTDRTKIANENIIDVFYEDFVYDPKECVNKIIDKFNLELNSSDFDYSYIKKGNVGKASKGLNNEVIKKIKSIISVTQSNVFKLKEKLN